MRKSSLLAVLALLVAALVPTQTLHAQDVDLSKNAQSVDGVLEATSATGEIFGFDRTRAISNETAEKIAETAREFGQEDDITVLTLRIAPLEAIHA